MCVFMLGLYTELHNIPRKLPNSKSKNNRYNRTIYYPGESMVLRDPIYHPRVRAIVDTTLYTDSCHPKGIAQSEFLTPSLLYCPTTALGGGGDAHLDLNLRVQVRQQVGSASTRSADTGPADGLPLLVVSTRRAKMASASSDSDGVGFESVSESSSGSDSDSESGEMHATRNSRGQQSGDNEEQKDYVSLLDKATASVKSRMKETMKQAVSNAPGGGVRRTNNLSKRKRNNVDSDSPSREARKITKDDPVNKSAVIYIGHIPHGFYEDQMRSYFSQFGDVRRLRLSRNKKTGRSKHYAFIEFDKRSTAKIVAATMNGYFLAGRQLVSHVVKTNSVHPKMFAGSNRKFRPIPWRLIAKQKHNAPRTESQQAQRIEKLKSKEAKKRAKLKAMGIDYDFAGYSGKKVNAEQGEEESQASKRQKTDPKDSAKKGKKSKKRKSTKTKT